MFKRDRTPTGGPVVASGAAADARRWRRSGIVTARSSVGPRELRQSVATMRRRRGARHGVEGFRRRPTRPRAAACATSGRAAKGGERGRLFLRVLTEAPPRKTRLLGDGPGKDARSTASAGRSAARGRHFNKRFAGVASAGSRGRSRLEDESAALERPVPIWRSANRCRKAPRGKCRQARRSPQPIRASSHRGPADAY